MSDRVCRDDSLRCGWSLGCLEDDLACIPGDANVVERRRRSRSVDDRPVAILANNGPRAIKEAHEVHIGNNLDRRT